MELIGQLSSGPTGAQLTHLTVEGVLLQAHLVCLLFTHSIDNHAEFSISYFFGIFSSYSALLGNLLFIRDFICILQKPLSYWKRVQETEGSHS